VQEVIRKMGNRKRPFYNWKEDVRVLAHEVRRLKQLEEENRRLKQMVADLSLDKQMLQERTFKKNSEACSQRHSGRVIERALQVTERRGLQCNPYQPTSYRYPADQR